ncbi:MAG: YggS family pyridoxal phosphate-dependent enzyme [Clostridium sp.]
MSIKDNIISIESKIPKGVKLISVSKTKPVNDILEAYSTGVRDFGENKVQELIEKIDQCPNDITWHLIGNLQTNKVKYIVGKVGLIQSLSSIKLLDKIEQEYQKRDLTANALIQINIGREESKGGFLVEEIDEVINKIKTCKHIKIHGIMTIIPKGSAESNRDYFRSTKMIFDNLNNLVGIENIQMDILSMGMSNDYEIAIEEGSTMVRIGQGIFGTR